MITPIINFKSQPYNVYKFPQKKTDFAQSAVEQPVRTPILSPIYFTSNIVKPKKCYVIGHKNPDTDSIVSAIAYAYLKEKIEGNKYIPIAAGNLNSETKYVLDFAGFRYPKIVEDFDTKIAEITNTPANKRAILNETSTVKDFGDMVLNKNIRSAPIINSKTKELLGMVSEKDLAKAFLSSAQVADSGMNYKAISRTINARVLAGENILNHKFTGRLIVGASLEQTTINSLQKDDLLIVGDRERVQKAAIEKGVKCIIVTRNREVSDDIIALAKRNHVVILSSPLDTYSTAKLVDQSKPVTSIMTPEPETIDGKARLSDIRKRIQNYPHRSYPVMKDGIFIGTVEKVDILNPLEREFILVDHNDLEQTAKGIKNEEVVGIIDHHKSVFTSNREDRIDTVTKKCGSTSTLVAKEFKANSVRIPKDIAKLLLCGILSDTDNLTSPTKTPDDEAMVKELAKILQITNVECFGKKLLGSRGEEIDTKKYTLGDGSTAAIMQAFTYDFEAYMKNHGDIYECLNKYDKENKTDGCLFMLTNPQEQISYLFGSDKFTEIAYEQLSNGMTSKLNEKAINNSTVKEALLKICHSSANDEPAIFDSTSSRKEQVEPFVRKVYSYS